MLWAMSEILLPVFSSMIFMVSGLPLKYLIHFEFILVCGVRRWFSFIFLHISVQISQQRLLNKLSLTQCVFLCPWLNLNWLWGCEFISGLFILFHWSVCLFLCHYHADLITMALSYSFLLGSMIPPTLFLFLGITIVIRLFVFPYTFLGPF